MRKWFNVVAIAFAMVLGSFAMAADAPTGAKPVHGKVTAIAKETADPKITDITISSHGKNGAAATETVLKVDDSTKITKDGACRHPAADVTVGVGVSVTMGDNNKGRIHRDSRPPKRSPPRPLTNSRRVSNVTTARRDSSRRATALADVILSIFLVPYDIPKNRLTHQKPHLATLFLSVAHYLRSSHNAPSVARPKTLTTLRGPIYGDLTDEHSDRI